MTRIRLTIRNLTGGHRGFTLLEVSVSIAILGMMLGGLMVAYSRTADRIAMGMVRSRGMDIAQKKMEYLLASLQEPNVIDMSGEDEDDPAFHWDLELKRIPIGTPMIKQDLSNTVIEIKVTVKHQEEKEETGTKVELTRYVAGMKPRPGQVVAVPASSQREEPLWLLELREKLGREPTPEEVMQQMMKASGMSEDLFKQMQPSDTGTEGDETPGKTGP
jgi:prepilin-type N-terminal cleavage/methylation domain-containing protein